jgi:hypothetical protein
MISAVNLPDKKLDLDAAAKLAAHDQSLRACLLAGISPENHDPALRYNSFRVLMRLAVSHPDLLMPYWDLFVAELHDPRSDQQYIGIRLLAELVPQEVTHRFDPIFDLYFGMLSKSGLINANQVAGVAWKFVLARPDLEPRITHQLLAFHNPNLDVMRNDLVKSYAIDSFHKYSEQVRDKKAILGFVKDLAGSPSPRARKSVKVFLKAHPKDLKNNG